MKPLDAGILLFSNGVLIAGVLGEALPPESIPIQCASICGPMVELTSICSGRSSQENSAPFLNSRRKRANENQNTGADRKQEAKRQPKDGVELAKRNFTVIVPAPTSFPSSLLVQTGTLAPPHQSKITQIRPTVIFPVQEPPPHPSPSPPPPSSSSAPPPPPAVATPAPTQQHPSTSTPTESDVQQNSPSTTGLVGGSVSPTTSRRPQSSVDATNDGDEGNDDDGSDDGDDHNHTNSSGAKPDKNEDGWVMEDGEEECVCENKSFNVARVAALCSSCIATASEQQNDMHVIMATCKFAPEQYSPEKDSIVNNIQVQATPSKAVWGQNAGVAKAGAAMLMPIQGVQMAVGAALSFLHLWVL
ncbi:hypothetical protein MY11210_008973 [Beauveria gryllotalpidicola]